MSAGEKFWRFGQAIDDLRSRPFEEEIERPIFLAGKLKSWLSFEFKLISSCYDLNDRDKIHLIKHYSGPFLKKITRWIPGDDDDGANFKEFCKVVLDKVLNVVATPEKLMFEFMKMQQKPNESSEDFVCKLMQYSHYMDFTGDQAENRLFLSAIIENANEHELRRYAIEFLSNKKTETLKSTELKSKMIWKARYVDEMNEISRKNALKNQIRNAQQFSQFQSGKFCFNCGKSGHVTKACRYLKSF